MTRAFCITLTLVAISSFIACRPKTTPVATGFDATVRFPATYTIERYDREGEKGVYAKSPERLSNGAPTVIVDVARYTGSADEGVPETLFAYTRYLISQMEGTYESFSVIQEEDASIAGYPARMFRATYNVGLPHVKDEMFLAYVFVDDKNNRYVISGYAPKRLFPRYHRVIERAATSFRFTAN